jgi:hypothetical protein
MSTSITTPTGKQFNFEVDAQEKCIIITSQNNFKFRYRLCALKDLLVWLKDNCGGKWVYLGSRGEEETPKEGTVEKWARSSTNPVGGFYGITPGRKGRFASYIPSILEYYCFVEIEHKPQNNRIRAL